MLDAAALGRYAETARLVLAALRDGPRQHVLLFDQVRALDGPVGHGTLYGAVARLERLGLIEPTNAGGRRAYRLLSPAWAAQLGGTQEGIES